MPNSPGGLCLDCCSRAIPGSKYCAKHQTENHAATNELLYDRYRANDPIRKMYRNARWMAVRRRVLNRDVLCVHCGHCAATDVDHILSARLVVENYGKDAFYDISRLQGLCHSCHSTKTATEYGWTGNKGTKLEQLTDRSNTTVVCGAPCSGKTTYVATHKGEDDHVWDFDVVMQELTGLPMHQGLTGAIGSVLAHRDAFINRTAHSPHHVWIIVTNPRAAIVRLLEAAGASVVVLDTSDEVCQQRQRERFLSENK